MTVQILPGFDRPQQVRELFTEYTKIIIDTATAASGTISPFRIMTRSFCIWKTNTARLTVGCILPTVTASWPDALPCGSWMTPGAK